MIRARLRCHGGCCGMPPRSLTLDWGIPIPQLLRLLAAEGSQLWKSPSVEGNCLTQGSGPLLMGNYIQRLVAWTMQRPGLLASIWDNSKGSPCFQSWGLCCAVMAVQLLPVASLAALTPCTCSSHWHSPVIFLCPDLHLTVCPRNPNYERCVRRKHVILKPLTN